MKPCMRIRGDWTRYVRASLHYHLFQHAVDWRSILALFCRIVYIGS